MSAREKLNGVYVAGSVVVAALLGLLTGSRAVFFVALGSLLVVNGLSGNIRPPGPKR
jgi:hypothetical protein